MRRRRAAESSVVCLWGFSPVGQQPPPPHDCASIVIRPDLLITQGGPLDYNRFRSRYWDPAVKASVGRPLELTEVGYIWGLYGMEALMAEHEQQRLVRHRLAMLRHAEEVT